MQSPIDDPVVDKDLVLIYLENQPAFYARVEGFTPDTKPKWWHVKLLILQVPVTVVSWILRREQINGEEFTMNGTPIRIEKVKVPQPALPDNLPDGEETASASKNTKDNSTQEQASNERNAGKSARILSFDGPKKQR